MECGHACESLCHNFITDDESDPTGHNYIKCLKKCVRERDCGHPCKKLCFKCKDGHKNDCDEKVIITHEKCGHQSKYKCFEVFGLKEPECRSNCSKKLPCGHDCKRLCKVDCDTIYPADLKKGYTTPCKEKVLKELPCGHKAEVDCGLPASIHYKKEGC